MEDVRGLKVYRGIRNIKNSVRRSISKRMLRRLKILKSEYHI